MVGSRVLRSGDRVGLEQELWALLSLYQLLRTAMVAAVESVPGIDPDRAGFTIAYQATRDQVVTTEAVVTDQVDLVGRIGRKVLAELLPPRRLRVSGRKVKASASRYHTRKPDGRPVTSQHVTALDIEVHEPDIIEYTEQPPTPGPNTRSETPGTARTRRERVMGLMRSDPTRAWHASQIAQWLDATNPLSVYVQLSQWAKTGQLHKISPATHTLP